MLLNKNNLIAVKAASTDETRQTLQGLYIMPDRTVATDGHRLIEVMNPDPAVDEAHYPAIEGNKGGAAADLKPFIMQTDDVEAILKAIPKKAKMPILENAILDVAATNANGSARVTTTDLSNAVTFTPHKVEGQFPDYEIVFPKHPDTFEICFNPALLADTLKTVAEIMGNGKKKFDQRSVKLTFYHTGKDSQSPVKIEAVNQDTGQKIRALVMPMRGDK